MPVKNGQNGQKLDITFKKCLFKGAKTPWII